MRLLSNLMLGLLGGASALAAQTSAPPVRDYMMPRDAELALVRTAAPEGITSRATLELLTPAGYEVAHAGDNGFVCLVLRGWSAPTYTPAQFRDFVHDAAIRAPICYNPAAARTVLPLQHLRAKLGMAGKGAEQIAEGVQSAYARGEIPRMEGVAFAYMFSAEQNLGRGIGAFHPHVMVFAPYHDNAMLGDNAFGGPFPFVSDDAGTPFSVTVIPVDHALAMRSR
ncbi:MAG: hypothetical protein JWL95_2242 [Gemmatimonadetes bacterium]|nr:hypothetical protein [Gemmatimonadota bacterium]